MRADAGRSQMAAVLTQALAGDQVHVRSASSAPAKTLHPEAVDSIAELGLDLGQEFPEPLTDPSGLDPDEVRAIRDELHAHVTELLASLGVTPIELEGSRA